MSLFARLYSALRRGGRGDSIRLLSPRLPVGENSSVGARVLIALGGPGAVDCERSDGAVLERLVVLASGGRRAALGVGARRQHLGLPGRPAPRNLRRFKNAAMAGC